MQVGTHAAVQGLDMMLQCDGVALRIRHVRERIPVCIVLASVPDPPDPPDPHVFGLSGSFYHQAKIV